jgi:hypothetical protein
MQATLLSGQTGNELLETLSKVVRPAFDVRSLTATKNKWMTFRPPWSQRRRRIEDRTCFRDPLPLPAIGQPCNFLRIDGDHPM